MNKYRIRYTPLAVDDLDLAFSYIAQENLQAAKELLDKLENAVLQLKDFPYLGVVFPNKETYEVTGYRYLAVDAYVIFYRIDDVQKENADCPRVSLAKTGCIWPYRLKGKVLLERSAF